jgi:hypothetical protein
LAVLARIAARAAIAYGDVEHLVGTEDDRAAVVVAPGLADGHRAMLGVRVDPGCRRRAFGAFAHLDDEARDDALLQSPADALAVVDPDVPVFGETRVEGEAEEALLVVPTRTRMEDPLALVEEERALATLPICGDAPDLAELGADVDEARVGGVVLQEQGTVELGLTGEGVLEAECHSFLPSREGGTAGDQAREAAEGAETEQAEGRRRQDLQWHRCFESEREASRGLHSTSRPPTLAVAPGSATIAA